MALSQQWLDELRARVTLSSVIMRTDKLQRNGREWKACCPFHDEKTPSFTVNDQKGFYHCFGCGAHGDVIRWMTDQRGMPFMDAVKQLAEEAGMELPAPDPQAAKRAEKRAELVDVTEAAQSWFFENLNGSDGVRARQYLETRGLSADIIRKFGFGYAPDSKQALNRALSRFDEDMLVQSGMRIAKDDGNHYDRFRDRLMLPIQDNRGRVIAFGGRILGNRDGVAKYLNSPETPLFDKGRTLYNIHRAGPASRKSNRLIVVEGYMDVIALANAGFDDAVAPLGTALTETQIELLWRMVDVPILCFDGDNAGQKAAMRAIGRALPLLRPGKSLQIAQLPAGLDPDDLLARHGRGKMDQLLDNASPLVDVLWQGERDAQPLSTPEDKAGLKARLIAHIDTIADADIKALYRRELLERYSAYAFPKRERDDWQGQNWRSQGNRWAGKSGSANRYKPRISRLSDDASNRLRNLTSGGAHNRLAAAVIAGLARYPAEIADHAEALSSYSARNPELAETIDFLLSQSEMLEPGVKTPISLPPGLTTPSDETRFSFLCEGTDPTLARNDLAEALMLLVERPAIEAALAAATAQFDQDPEGAFAEQQRLLKRKLDFERRFGQMIANVAARPAPNENDTTTDPQENAAR